MSTFWHNKSVFLTGHTGFKGGWLSLWLSALGARVSGYSTPPPTEPSLFECARVQEVLAHHAIGDVRDRASLAKALAQSNPDIVFHLAAQPLVRASYAMPVETYETNVLGTVNLLDVCRAQPSVKAVVIVTSDKCYENRETLHPYSELDPMGGWDPYSSSKGCAELVTAAYARSFYGHSSSQASVASVRAGNVVGGGDWAPDRLMADLMRGLTAGTTTVLRSPNSIRPWQHVLEPLSGYLLVAEGLCKKPQMWEGWNFGPTKAGARTVQEVAELTCAMWGRPELLAVENSAVNLHEAKLLTLDIRKARERLGWSPCLDMHSTIGLTVDWFKEFSKGADMQSVTLRQVRDYVDRRAGASCGSDE